MINTQNLDEDTRPFSDEKELLEKDVDQIRQFYSLTGDPRSEYVIQMAKAEAEKIRTIRQAQAEGLLAIRKAEAEGLKLIGQALSTLEQPELVMQLSGLMALQEVAKQLADGQATKLFLPQSVGDVFSLVGAWKEVLGSASTTETSE